MNRRHFQRSLFLGLGGLSTYHLNAKGPAVKRRILPRLLAKGQTVGLITPGSFISDEGLEKAVNNMEALGLHVKLSTHIRAERGFTAGRDGERLADLHSMFVDPQVDAIWCARGGYGCSRLLPYLDYRLFSREPKMLIGYSDITALHNAIFEKTGLITFHGPVASSEQSDYTLAQMEAVLFEGRMPYQIPHSTDNQAEEADAYQTRTIRAGQARGALVGGNLTLLSAMVGTDYLPSVKNKIVFLEDIGEKPYRIDRMLTTLRQAWPLEQAAGLALGIFADCEPDEDDRSLSLAETLDDRLGDLDIPVVYGLSFGHIKDQCTIPVGIPATLNATEQWLRLEEW